MARKMVTVLAMLAAVAWAFGCGGSELSDNAVAAKPKELGDPSQFQVGVTAVSNGSDWAIVTEADGAKQLRVFANRVNAVIPQDRNLPLQFDAEKKEFYSKGRDYTYDMTGEATWKIKKGSTAGQPGPRMIQRPVEIDKATGKIVYYNYKTVEKADREVEGKGFVTLP